MRETNDTKRGALRLVPYMGVIYVVTEAMKLGFTNGDPDWCNLGQGQPEVGEMEGAPARHGFFEVRPEDHAYGPVEGTQELRQSIADHYNRLYRSGREPQYSWKNVVVSAGGRLALSRSILALGEKCRIGYQIPDYSAYEDMLGSQMPRYQPVGLEANEEDGFKLTPEMFANAVRDHSLDAMLISNPCNPTGCVIAGDELDQWVSISRRENVTLLMDEFYSHFIYCADGGPGEGGVSSAAFIEDVESDPVLIFDGLTKNFRYPGWRLGWVVGPERMVETLITAGSSIDGGPCRIVQRAALEVLQPEPADQALVALRQVFAAKRDLLIDRLTAMGIRFPAPSEGTFYAWGCLDGLPAPFNKSDAFFRAALAAKVMVVPGAFFDVNPAGERPNSGRFDNWLRFSFGPPIDNVRLGLDRLESMLTGA